MPRDRLTRAQTAGYAAGSVGTGGFGTLPGLVLAYYLTDTLGVAAALAAVVVLLPKVWDVVIDPAIGARSDRELTTRGSRHRLMTLGALTLPVGFVAMFAVPDGWSGAVAAVWVTVAFVLATTSFSLFQVPYIAAPADLTSDYAERTRMMAWRVGVLALAILVFGAGAPGVRALLGGGRAGYLVMAVVSALALTAGMLATVASLRGHDAPAARVAQPPTLRAGVDALRELPRFRALLVVFVLQALAVGIVLAATQYVATYLLGSASWVSVLFAAVVAPALVVMPAWKRYGAARGKRTAYLASSRLFVLACALQLPALGLGWVWLSVLALALGGVAYAGMQLFPLAMLPDVVEEAGRARGGAMSGVWTALETAGLALGPGIVLVMLAVGGFVSSTGDPVAQPRGAEVAMALAFSLVPALLAVLSIAALRRYEEPEVGHDGR
ncbi:MFS transporter [Knoellia aerolata]|uniref:MFS transporter n=1 Tax=Knoellia aerolata DSM 18566 TaxID=1385519 RepID=A0A0A0JSA5_9MICO|nr:MFS transporter [Knoellia aerolata]KGN40340.1 MFS transporter [Knoellia aerolata DSM 18566]